MIRLQSMDDFGMIADLEPSTGKWTVSTKDLGSKAGSPCEGHFARVGGRTAALYRRAGVLVFRIEDREIALSQEVGAEWTRGTRNVLTLVRHGRPLYSWEYDAPEIDPPLALDPVGLSEEEDFDFGLFVYNVLSDPARRERIYR